MKRFLFLSVIVFIAIMAIVSLYEREDDKTTELIKFYVTDDDNHMPVRLDMNLSFGTAKAYLRSYQGVRNEMTSIIK